MKISFLSISLTLSVSLSLSLSVPYHVLCVWGCKSVWIWECVGVLLGRQLKASCMLLKFICLESHFLFGFWAHLTKNLFLPLSSSQNQQQNNSMTDLYLAKIYRWWHYTSNSNTLEAEIGKSWVWCQPGLYIVRRKKETEEGRGEENKRNIGIRKLHLQYFKNTQS